MAAGQVQVWPGMPVAGPLIERGRVAGVRLADQGVGPDGRPGAGFMPGMDVRASLTVVADGPVGPVGRRLDEHFGLPAGHARREWAVGMKMVVDLPPGGTLPPGRCSTPWAIPNPRSSAFSTCNRAGRLRWGCSSPPPSTAPVRTGYRYLQHWMRHPYLWKHLDGAVMRSWGAKSLQESGRAGEPYLAGNGYARIGEGSGSTNVLTGSGVDEAWTTGAQLAEGVLEILRERGSRSPARRWSGPTWPAAGRAGWSARRAKPSTLAPASTAA